MCQYNTVITAIYHPQIICNVAITVEELVLLTKSIRNYICRLFQTNECETTRKAAKSSTMSQNIMYNHDLKNKMSKVSWLSLSGLWQKERTSRVLKISNHSATESSSPEYIKQIKDHLRKSLMGNIGQMFQSMIYNYQKLTEKEAHP